MSFSIASLIEAVKTAFVAGLATVKGWFTTTPTVTEGVTAEGAASAASTAAAAAGAANASTKNGGWWDSIKAGLAKAAEYCALPAQYLDKGVAKLAQALGLGNFMHAVLGVVVAYGLSSINPWMTFGLLVSYLCDAYVSSPVTISLKPIAA